MAIKIKVNAYRRQWLKDNNIDYHIITTQLNPYSFEPVPIQVEISEKDAVLFHLRWGIS